MSKHKNHVAAFFVALALPLFLSAIAAQPAFAHGNEAHVAAPPSDHPATPNGDMSTMDMPATDMPSAEMTWPTGDEDGGMMMSHRPRPTTFSGRVIAWLGAWHPAVIHFPIALLLTVAFLELAALVRRKPLYNASNKILLAVGVVGAFVAAPLGWADAGLPTAEDGWALTTHRWLGSAIPFVMLLLWYLKKPAEQAAVRPSSRLYEIVLVVAVAVVLTQAYLGGEVTHGANHMAF
jgi:uncharacterized membrane protein